MANLYYYTDQILVWMKDNLIAETSLGLKYVDYGDAEDAIPFFPAVIITNAPRERELHATHMFMVTFQIDLWVLHANMRATYSQRKLEDIQLCNAIQDFLDLHNQLDTPENEDNIIFGNVSAESPGILNRKGTPIVATRLHWVGRSIQPFQ